MADPNPAPAAAPAAPAAPAAAPAAAATALSQAPAAAAPAAPAASAPAAATTWPNDWRNQFAGDDDKALTRLQRFVSPKDIFTSYRALEQRLSSGELKTVSPFPAKGTPEQQNAWRKENGIPEKAEAYDTKVEGVTIEDSDKPWLNSYLKAAHAANVPNSVVKETIKWHADFKQSEADARAQSDNDVARQTVDALRAEWQGDYRTNMNGIEALLAIAPKGVGEKLKNSRFGDGTPIMSDPDTLRFLASLFRKVNPVSSVVPAGDEAQMAKSISDELTTIRERMRKDRAGYNKDEKMQARYRELIDAEKRLGGAKKAA